MECVCRICCFRKSVIDHTRITPAATSPPQKRIIKNCVWSSPCATVLATYYLSLQLLQGRHCLTIQFKGCYKNSWGDMTESHISAEIKITVLSPVYYNPNKHWVIKSSNQFLNLLPPNAHAKNYKCK